MARRWSASSVHGRDAGGERPVALIAALIAALAAGPASVLAQGTGPESLPWKEPLRPPAPGSATVAVSTPSPEPLDPAVAALPEFELKADDAPDGGWRVGDAIVLRPVSPPVELRKLRFPGEAGALTRAGWASHFPDRPEVKVVPLKPGALTLPVLRLVADRDREIGRTRPLTIEVASAIAVDDPNPTQPVDAPPPLELPFPWQYLAAAALLALALLGGVLYALVRWSRARRAPMPVAPAAPRPEHEIALAALEAVARAGHLARGEHKRHYFAVSEILKTYLGARFEFDAPERTSGEIVAHLEGERRLDPAGLDRLESLLARLDRVKFTDHVPGAEDGASVITDARRLVHETRRRASPESAGAETPAREAGGADAAR
jgi:hypothetical protein